MKNSNTFPHTRTSLILALGNEPNSSVWREFFRHYASPVFRIAKLRGLQTSDAEDIVQDVMAAIAKQISSFDYRRDRGRFRDWVQRITSNKIIDFFRKQRPNKMGNIADLSKLDIDSINMTKQWEHQWLMQDLEYCLDRLTSRISAKRIGAFRMYALEGLSADDTAKTFGMSPGYVYVNRNQIVNMIRDEMSRLEGRTGNEP